MDIKDHIEEELMSIKAVCSYLRISKGTLRKLPIPRIHIRRRILYCKSELLTYIKENTKENKNG